MNLGIDAGDLLNERNEKTRYVEALLAAFSTSSRVTATLLCPSDQVELIAARYAHSPIRVADEKTARRDGYDMVWYPWNTLRFPTASPKVATIHDALAFTAPARNFFARRREKKALIQAARECDRIVTCTLWARDLVSALLDVAEDAISIVRPMPAIRWHAALDPLPFTNLGDMPYVMTVPGMRGPQNLEVFFHAFARAFKKRNIRLIVCGEVPSGLHKLFSKIGNARILQPSEQELRALYRNAAAVAFPALEDPCGFSAAEASACGAAVIAADAGALPEVVGTTAMLVEAKSRKAWIDGLQEIIDDEATNARLRAQAVSSRNATARAAHADRLIDIFERI